MAANPQLQQPLQARAQKFGNHETFESVVALNPDFDSWEPSDRDAFAGEFFKEKYASYDPGDQQVLRTVFNKKYNVGQVSAVNQWAKDPVSQIVGPALDIGNLITLGIPARSYDAMNFGAINTGDARDAQLAAYATDPTWKGDLYRTSQNDVVKGLAGLPGAFRSTAGMIGQAGMSGLAGLASAFTSNPVSKHLAGTATRAANTMGAAGYSGAANAIQMAQGKQNPLQAVTNTAVNAFAAPLAGVSRTGNVIKQAGAGGTASVLSDLIAGLPIDLQKAIREAGIGAGMGAAFHSPPSQKVAQQPRLSHPYPNRVVTLRPGTVAGMQDARQLQASVTKRQGEVLSAQAVTEQKTYQDRLNNLNRMYKQLDDVERGGQPVVSKRAATMKAAVKRQFDQVTAEKEAKFPSRKPAKPTKTLKSEQLPIVVKQGLKAVKAGGVQRKRFNDVVKGYDKASQDKIRRGIEDAVKTEKANRQAEANRSALRREAGKEKAQEIARDRKVQSDKEIVDAKTRIKEAEKQAEAKPKTDPERKKLEAAIEDAKARVAHRERKEVDAADAARVKALREDIISRSKNETQAKEIKEKAKARGEETTQSQEGMAKYLRTAHDKDQSVLIEYEAQGGKSGKGGESLDNSYRYKYDTVIEPPHFNRQGVAQIRVINEQGQLRTRLLNETESGSRIASVTKTGEPARFKLEDGKVIDVETGKVVEQVKGEARFSSEIRADIEKIESFNRTLRKYKEKKARVGDIVKASRDLDDAALEKELEEADHKVNDDIHKDSTGEPCP